jgi:RNA polymerase sigma-70 factor, ECF subfamily
MTDAELETMIRVHQAEIYRYVRYLGAENSAVAEDLVQETFLAAFKSSAPPVQRDERHEAGWLRGIARNMFLAHCRKARSNPVRVVDSMTLSQAENVWVTEFLRGDDGFDYKEALHKCLGTLSEKQRRVLDLYYAQGKSRAEMAGLCEMTEDGIKSLMRRLRGVLGECIKRRLAAE